MKRTSPSPHSLELDDIFLLIGGKIRNNSVNRQVMVLNPVDASDVLVLKTEWKTKRKLWTISTDVVRERVKQRPS